MLLLKILFIIAIGVISISALMIGGFIWVKWLCGIIAKIDSGEIYNKEIKSSAIRYCRLHQKPCDIVSICYVNNFQCLNCDHMTRRIMK